MYGRRDTRVIRQLNGSTERSKMDKYDIAEAITFNAEEIAQEIFDAEWIQKNGSSQYEKESAKQIAYDHIIELIVGRGE